MKLINTVAGVVMAAVGAAGCATVADGEIAKPIDMKGQYLPTTTTSSGLVVHARELPELSSEDTGVVEVTLENTTHRWIRLDAVRLDFADPVKNQNVIAPDGADLAAWHTAITERNAARLENEQAVLGLIMLGGAITAGTSHSGGLRAAGTSLAVAAAVASSSAAHAAGEPSTLYPDTHLLAVPIVVAPGLFSRRWIALNTKPAINGQCLTWAVLDYDTSDHGRERVVISFRTRWNGSEWQSDACRRELPSLTGMR
jgi:hypothetical protein